MNDLHGSKPASELRPDVDMVAVGDRFELVRHRSYTPSGLVRVATADRVLYFSETEQCSWMTREHAAELASEALEAVEAIKERARG